MRGAINLALEKGERVTMEGKGRGEAEKVTGVVANNLNGNKNNFRTAVLI